MGWSFCRDTLRTLLSMIVILLGLSQEIAVPSFTASVTTKAKYWWRIVGFLTANRGQICLLSRIPRWSSKTPLCKEILPTILTTDLLLQTQIWNAIPWKSTIKMHGMTWGRLMSDSLDWAKVAQSKSLIVSSAISRDISLHSYRHLEKVQLKLVDARYMISKARSKVWTVRALGLWWRLPT